MMLVGAGCGAPEDEDAYPFEVGDEPAEGGKADSLAGKYAGSPLEFDRGPSESWADLFARVPNYRQVSRDLGAQWLVPGPDGKTRYDLVNAARAAAAKPLPPIAKYTLTGDKFRYEMGPIFYRGRLDGTARVLVVGQDAATDEALVSRAFVGGTGQKVQYLLNSLGITKSYLCVNTFIYSIFEQYDEFTDELAMNGAIKDYRNDLMAKAFDENPIELIISFGSAAHDSVRKFRDQRLGGKLPPNVEWVQALHPGAAAVGLPPAGTTDQPIDDTLLKAVAASFARGYKRVWDRKQRQSGWLQPDSDGLKYRKSTYYYMSNDVPYRDLPFGVSPEAGRGGTKSERAQSGLQVQFRSSKGARYMAPSVPFPSTVQSRYSGVTLDSGELSWEPPKINSGRRHDPGPSAAWAERFAKTPAQEIIEAESGVQIASDFSEPVWYRGRLEGPAKVLVLIHDFGVDQAISGRAATGEAGQKLAHLLANVGVGLDYVVLNPFPYRTSNVALEQIETLALSPSLAAFRNQMIEELLAEKKITTVITLGHIAESAFQPITFKGTWIKLAHPSDSDAPASWNAALPQLKALFGGPAKSYRSTSFKNIRAAIPREDLAWGKPMWFGSSGDLSMHPHESWIFWNAPRWMNTQPVSR